MWGGGGGKGFAGQEISFGENTYFSLSILIKINFDFLVKNSITI